MRLLAERRMLWWETSSPGTENFAKVDSSSLQSQRAGGWRWRIQRLDGGISVRTERKKFNKIIFTNNLPYSPSTILSFLSHIITASYPLTLQRPANTQLTMKFAKLSLVGLKDQRIARFPVSINTHTLRSICALQTYRPISGRGCLLDEPASQWEACIYIHTFATHLLISM